MNTQTHHLATRATALFLSLLTLGALMMPAVAKSRKAVPALWTFAVSGDFRNCGGVVTPTIAAGCTVPPKTRINLHRAHRSVA